MQKKWVEPGVPLRCVWVDWSSGKSLLESFHSHRKQLVIELSSLFKVTSHISYRLSSSPVLSLLYKILILPIKGPKVADLSKFALIISRDGLDNQNMLYSPRHCLVSIQSISTNAILSHKTTLWLWLCMSQFYGV